MLYDESPKTSAEYLRLALPLIAQHQLGANPVNYAVMYEYVAGANEALTAALEARLRDGGGLDRETSEALFKTHVMPDAERLSGLQAQIMAMVEALEASVHAADDDVSRFGRSLRQCCSDLDAQPGSISEVLRELLAHTEEMKTSNEHLRAALDSHASEAEALRSQLLAARKEAITDPLTGLLNRGGFHTAVEQALDTLDECENGVCLMLLDIDRFKDVNDNYGHLFGDRVLKLVADVVRKCIKGKDAAGRFGGEEFSVLLPDTPVQGALSVAESIRRAVERARIRRTDNGQTIGNITLSAGVTCYRIGESFDALVQRADEALYAAKNGGRNRVNLATADAA